jgi:hypothetical protein
MERADMMSHRFAEPKEDFQVRRYYEVNELPQLQRSVDRHGFDSLLKDASHIDAGHGLAWCAWNGNRERGWTFYCACGYCTRMTRSFEDGLDLMEKHWQYRLAAPMAVPMQDPRSVNA